MKQIDFFPSRSELAFELQHSVLQRLLSFSTLCVCSACERGKSDDIFFSLATLGFRVHINIGIMEIDFWSFFRAIEKKIGTFFVASVDLEMAFEVKPKANVD